MLKIVLDRGEIVRLEDVTEPDEPVELLEGVDYTIQDWPEEVEDNEYVVDSYISQDELYKELGIR